MFDLIIISEERKEKRYYENCPILYNHREEFTKILQKAENLGGHYVSHTPPIMYMPNNESLHSLTSYIEELMCPQVKPLT